MIVIRKLRIYAGKQKYFNFSKNTISLRNSIFHFSKILKNFCVATGKIGRMGGRGKVLSLISFEGSISHREFLTEKV